MLKEITDFKHLIPHIIQIDNFRRSCLDSKLMASKILFQTKQFDMSIADIKRYLDIPQSIRIRVEVTEILDSRVGAQIILNHDMFGKPHIVPGDVYILRIKPRMIENFDVFCMLIVHELCHLKLFLSNLRDKNSFLFLNEKAVDILGILSGFGNVYRRVYDTYPIPNSKEYINKKEFDFIYDCFINNRKFRAKIPS